MTRKPEPCMALATIMDKSVETFCKTNAFKLTIILFFWMKTHFSSIVNPLPPKTMFQNASLMFFCFQHWKRGKGRLPFTTREENMMVISIYVNNFCPWLSEFDDLRKTGILSIFIPCRKNAVYPAYSASILFHEKAGHAHYSEIITSPMSHYWWKVLNQMVFHGVIGAEIRAYFRSLWKTMAPKARHSEEIQYFSCCCCRVLCFVYFI